MDHHDDIIRHSWPWKSPVFEIDNIRLILEVVPVREQRNRVKSYTIYLSLDSKVILPRSRVAITGECELLAKETGEQLCKIKPFRIVLYKFNGNYGSQIQHEVGKFLLSAIKKGGKTWAPCVVYKLSIWSVS